MPKYQVNVTRIGYSCRTIEVEAKSEKDAEDKAIDEAGSHDFSEHDSKYESEGAIEV